MNGAQNVRHRDWRDDRHVINARWLIKLRWVAVVGQLTTIFVVAFGIRITVQWAPLLLAIAITTLTNLAFTVWLRRREQIGFEIAQAVWHRVFMLLMVLDLVVLSLLLFFTGGHTNPFSLFYFVNLALSGILLPPSRAWLLNGMSILCFAALLFSQHAMPVLQEPERLMSVRSIGESTLVHQGLFVAFAACSSVIVYFVTRLNLELRRGDEARTRAGLLQARSDKWEALGTLSAGAAHELSTPLTTIAIVSKELQQALMGHDDLCDIQQDIETVRQEVNRCRTILDRMSIDAGHATSEPSVSLSAEQLIEGTLSEMREARERIHAEIQRAARSVCVNVPSQSVMQALRAIIQNGLDASKEQVDVVVSLQGATLQIQIRDRGSGMGTEVLRRADEPFFTTRDPGHGMGLGRFIARTVFERVGGTFATETAVDRGTVVTVRIPVGSSCSST